MGLSMIDFATLTLVDYGVALVLLLFGPVGPDFGPLLLVAGLVELRLLPGCHDEEGEGAL